MTSPDFGVQAFLWWKPEVADRDLQLVQEAGFKWVKQLVSWQDVEGAGKGQYDWTNLDRIVGQAEQHGLKLIVRVSQDPDRPFWAGNPPENAGPLRRLPGGHGKPLPGPHPGLPGVE